MIYAGKQLYVRPSISQPLLNRPSIHPLTHSSHPHPNHNYNRADDKTLAFYNVVAGGTIHMVLQLRGGLSQPQQSS